MCLVNPSWLLFDSSMNPNSSSQNQLYGSESDGEEMIFHDLQFSLNLRLRWDLTFLDGVMNTSMSSYKFFIAEPASCHRRHQFCPRHYPNLHLHRRTLYRRLTSQRSDFLSPRHSTRFSLGGMSNFLSGNRRDAPSPFNSTSRRSAYLWRVLATHLCYSTTLALHRMTRNCRAVPHCSSLAHRKKGKDCHSP